MAARVTVSADQTEACSMTGNRATAKVVFRQPGFNFSLIVDLLYDEDRAVQTVAGAALAAFSYNIASNQRLIARSASRPVIFAHFKDILADGGDELQRSNAAFQARSFFRKTSVSETIRQPPLVKS